jgi:hypothetical protein
LEAAATEAALEAAATEATDTTTAEATDTTTAEAADTTTAEAAVEATTTTEAAEAAADAAHPWEDEENGLVISHRERRWWRRHPTIAELRCGRAGPCQ